MHSCQYKSPRGETNCIIQKYILKKMKQKVIALNRFSTLLLILKTSLKGEWQKNFDWNLKKLTDWLSIGVYRSIDPRVLALAKLSSRPFTHLLSSTKQNQTKKDRRIRPDLAWFDDLLSYSLPFPRETARWHPLLSEIKYSCVSMHKKGTQASPTARKWEKSSCTVRPCLETKLPRDDPLELQEQSSFLANHFLSNNLGTDL